MAKFIDLDTGLPALLNKVKAWVNSKTEDFETELAGKQDTLTFDNAPTANSNNPVKSGGVYTALSGKANSADLSTVATSGSYNDLTNKPTILSQSDVQDMIDDTVEDAVGDVTVNAISNLQGTMGISHSNGITNFVFGYQSISAPPVITTSETDSQVVVTATGVGTIILYDNDSQVATGTGSASHTFTKGSSSSTHTMTATAKDGDKAVSAAASLEVTVPALSYIAGGLVFHLDGADATSSSWVDKIGNKSFALTDCTVNADGSVSFNGTSSKGLCSESPVVGDDWTIEVVYNNTLGTGNQFLFSWQNYRATNYGICYAFWNTQQKIINALYFNAAGSDRNFACAEVDFTPGIKVHSITSGSLRNVQSGTANGWGQTIGFRHEATSMKMQLGARYQPHNEYLDGLFAGKIYQIRVYNRALTADEISWNQAIDMDKYNIS